MEKKKRLAWRCKSTQQQKDKQEIYNSREWAELRVRKYQANPLCEMCIEEGKAAGVPDGYLTPTQCIHHIHPIEDSSSKQEMRMWAFKWENLQSLCLRHHALVHQQAGANKKENVAERRVLRQERWKDSMLSRFTRPKDDSEPSPSTPAPSF
ncbi:MAG: HNH endonuclease [Prevotella sp.]|nr:HNH endonuclease [Prevotella sp.]